MLLYRGGLGINGKFGKPFIFVKRELIEKISSQCWHRKCVIAIKIHEAKLGYAHIEMSILMGCEGGDLGFGTHFLLLIKIHSL